MVKGIKGFSLIELVIVLATITILSMLAYPSYIQYKIRIERTNVQSEMLKVAQRMQDYKATKNTYEGATIGSIYGITADLDNGVKAPKQGTPFYKLYFVDSEDVVLATTVANSWILKAVPIAGTQQVDNGVLCLNSEGQKYWIKVGTTCKNVLSNVSNWDSK